MQQPASSSTSVVMAYDVGARAVSDNLTRQDNATEYAAGDVLAAMAGEPLAAVPLVFAAGRAAGAGGTILRAVVTSSVVDATRPALFLYLFSSEPDLADDNAAFATALTDLIGVLALTSPQVVAGGTVWTTAAGDVYAYTCGATTNIWGVLVVGETWTPTEEQDFTVTLHVYRD